MTDAGSLHRDGLPHLPEPRNQQVDALRTPLQDREVVERVRLEGLSRAQLIDVEPAHIHLVARAHARKDVPTLQRRAQLRIRDEQPVLNWVPCTLAGFGHRRHAGGDSDVGPFIATGGQHLARVPHARLPQHGLFASISDQNGDALRADLRHERIVRAALNRNNLVAGLPELRRKLPPQLAKPADDHVAFGPPQP